MKKNSAMVAAFFLATLIPATAQDVFSHPMDEASKPQVILICNRMGQHKVIKASFTQTKTITRLSRTFTSTGRMIFDVARGLLWEVRDPFPSATVMTRDRIAQRSSSGKISVLPASNNDTFRRFSATMQAVLNGDFKSIENGFVIHFMMPSDGRWIIGLVPRDRTLLGVIKAMEIWGASDLEGFSLKEASGDSVTYKFSGVSYPEKLDINDEKAFF
ncbi:MAG: outer membrane lipoprotein carrier protein LolA [Spirochaetaceae bacterium]|nr:MAG: outer membrane lipoprotein carrier protein LolA [Spirochaetaceae bacterium]